MAPPGSTKEKVVPNCARVASLLKVAPPPMMNKGDTQTEDGHAMMKSDTFHSFRNLSQRERWCICNEC